MLPNYSEVSQATASPASQKLSPKKLFQNLEELPCLPGGPSKTHLTGCKLPPHADRRNTLQDARKQRPLQSPQAPRRSISSNPVCLARNFFSWIPPALLTYS